MIYLFVVSFFMHSDHQALADSKMDAPDDRLQTFDEITPPTPLLKMRSYKAGIGCIFALVSVFMAAYIFMPSKQTYENKEVGIRLQKPWNWDVSYFQRSGTIILNGWGGVTNAQSVRIEINTASCGAISTDTKTSIENIQWFVRNRQNMHAPLVVSVVESPRIVGSKNYEIARAAIDVPTVAWPADSKYNKSGVRSQSVLQRAELITIDNQGESARVEVYKGANNVVNSQADEVVNSIQLICK